MNILPIIYVIDDDDDMRLSLEWLFRPIGFQVQTFACVADFLASHTDNPGCLILDINLAGSNGLDFVRELPTRKIRLPVIVITGNADIPTAISAMKAGAIDFVTKPFDGSKLIELVRITVEKSLMQLERRRGPAGKNQRAYRLTPREREVMGLLLEGKTNKEIAQSLTISIRTVDTHRSEIMRKLEVKSFTELLRLVIGDNVRFNEI
jgi:two-component system, LuxR family, response regulator FixJ